MESVVRLKQIRELIDHHPFRPFQICMSDGREHVISRPDLVFLTRDTVIVGVLDQDDDVPDHAIFFDTLHITRIEPVRERPTE
jgi:hypothetical protein